MPFSLQLLGDFRARGSGGREISISAKKSRALLAVVALSPNRTVPREHLAALLWSDRGETQARSSLRQTLTVLRKELAEAGNAFLLADDDKVELQRSSIDIDAVTFLDLASSSEAAALRQAVDLYRGELLADTFITDPAFEEWIAAERLRFRGAMSEALARLIPKERAENGWPWPNAYWTSIRCGNHPIAF